MSYCKKPPHQADDKRTLHPRACKFLPALDRGSQTNELSLASLVHSKGPMQGGESLNLRGAGSISGIALRILRYLVDHPRAGDTAEGIVDWWLAQGDVSVERKSVEAALDELLQRDLITIVRAADRRSHYRLNCERIEDTRSLLKLAEQ